MRLSETVDMEKKYKDWINAVLRKLESDDIIYEITEEHRRGDVYPDESNYTVTRNTGRQMDPNILLRLLAVLYDEYNRLENAFWDICGEREMNLEYDAGIYLEYKNALEALEQLKSLEEQVIYETQSGYKVNSEDKQVSYVCHIRKTLIPDFDQDKIAQMYDEMLQKYMDRRSIVEALENDVVPFQSIFNRVDSLEDVYRIFQAQSKA